MRVRMSSLLHPYTHGRFIVSAERFVDLTQTVDLTHASSNAIVLYMF